MQIFSPFSMVVSCESEAKSASWEFFFKRLFSNLTFSLLECTHLGVYGCEFATP